MVIVGRIKFVECACNYKGICPRGKEIKMKIGIITQPLLNNYGGVLQNYALQETLRKMGYEPITIDYIPPRKSLLRYFVVVLKTLILNLAGKKKPFPKRELFCRKQQFESFVCEKINKTLTVNSYDGCGDCFGIDCFVVGSDQVWRPLYNGRTIKDMFLNFCEKKDGLKRVAYAASFGVDDWEFSSRLTKDCSLLAKKFDAISVREESGIKLCRDYLNVDASWVIDPTLLLEKEDYCRLCADVPAKTGVLVVYVLNMNESIAAACKKIAEEKGLTPRYFGSDSNATLTIPEWLAMFRDASYVVTDSFHGTVFSIIFEKDFKCFYNQYRGNARFTSLLNIYHSGKMNEFRIFSIDWLKNALQISV